MPPNPIFILLSSLLANLEHSTVHRTSQSGKNPIIYLFLFQDFVQTCHNFTFFLCRLVVRQYNDNIICSNSKFSSQYCRYKDVIQDQKKQNEVQH